MGARRLPTTKPQGGRPTRLIEPGVYDNLTAAIELGVPVSIACQGVGVAEQSFRNWMRRGATEQMSRAAGAEPNDDEQVYLDLYNEVLAARTKAATRNVGVIQKAAQGGSITSRTVRRYRNEDGEMVEEETVNRAAPDWRAAAWYLERAHRSEYGKDAVQVEIHSPSGDQSGDTPDPNRSPEQDLAARLTRFRAEHVVALPSRADAGEGDEDDVAEGEIVEDE